MMMMVKRKRKKMMVMVPELDRASLPILDAILEHPAK